VRGVGDICCATAPIVGRDGLRACLGTSDKEKKEGPPEQSIERHWSPKLNWEILKSEAKRPVSLQLVESLGVCAFLKTAPDASAPPTDPDVSDP
jgi:hypothetical protein